MPTVLNLLVACSDQAAKGSFSIEDDQQLY